MKVLMTGYTSNQSVVFRSKNLLYSGASALAYSLQMMPGVDLTIDTVYPDTDLSEYDLIVCGFYAPNSLSSYRSLNLVPKLVDSGVPVRYYLDDWHLRNMYNGMSAHMKPKNIWRVAKYMLKDERLEYALENVMKIVSFYRRLEEEPITFLTPMLPWAIHHAAELESVFEGRAKLLPYDPSVAFPEVLPTYDGPRSSGWVLSSRYDYREWIDELNLSWPVVIYGHRKNPNAKIVPNELDLIDEYAQYTGVLSHPYHPQNHMGQWRNRYLFAIWSGCALAVPEAEAFGVAEYDVRPSDIDTLPFEELEELTRAQGRAYKTLMWSKDRLMDWISENVLNV